MKYKYPSKQYFHIDSILYYTDKVKSYVENPKKISQHGFLPFLKYEKIYTKFLGYGKNEGKKVDPKSRSIMFASHIDSFIYSHYGAIISEKYNEWTVSHNIDECSIAYRNNKKGKSNIQFAAEVIREIVKCRKCYIFVGDFSKFFDGIEHKQLKGCLKEVLQVSRLEKDYHKVLKSLMEYSYVELKQLKLWLTKQRINFEKIKRYFSSIKEFREFRSSTKLVQKNTDGVGIPQGSAMSGLLANIYMIHADEDIHRLVREYNGLYRRYSDDFIIVIPYNSSCSMIEFEKVVDKVMSICQEAEVKLHKDKTNEYFYDNGNIKTLESQDNSALTYLGFRFDGKCITARQGSVYKFYRGAEDAISRAEAKSKDRRSKVLLRKSLINRLYMDVGSKPRWDKKRNRIKYGNFISYMKRAQKEFEKIDGVECRILEQIKHRGKIMRRYRRAKENVENINGEK